MKRRAGWTAAITLAMGMTGLAQQPESEPALTVCLTVSDGLTMDASLKAAVLSEVNRVWRPLGVAVTERVESNGTCDRPILVKSDREARPEDGGGETSIAWVTFRCGTRPAVGVRADGPCAHVDRRLQPRQVWHTATWPDRPVAGEASRPKPGSRVGAHPPEQPGTRAVGAHARALWRARRAPRHSVRLHAQPGATRAPLRTVSHTGAEMRAA